MPDFGYVQLTVPGSSTLSPNPGASDWAGTVPADDTLDGMIVFNGVLGPDVSQIRLTFTKVFGSLNGPDSIAVDIPISSA